MIDQQIKVGLKNYRILKQHNETDLYKTFLVSDTNNKDNKVILRIFDLSKLNLSRNDLKNIENLLETISSFKHENIVNIIDFSYNETSFFIITEKVEGLTLKQIADMSISPLAEKDVVPWMMQVCDAISYLHKRPEPFIANKIDLEHISITNDEKIKLLNLGLERLFHPKDRNEMFINKTEFFIDDIEAILKVDYELITKTEFSEDCDILENLPVDVCEDHRKLLEINLPQCHNINTAEDLNHNYNLILHPELKCKYDHHTVVTRFNFFSINKFIYEKILFPVLSQSLLMLSLEIIGLIVFFYGMWLMQNPHVLYKKQGQEFYIITNSTDLRTYRVNKPKFIDRLIYPEGISAMLEIQDKPKNQLIISLENSSTIALIDPEKNIETARIKVCKGPGKIIYDKLNNKIFVVSNKTKNVSIVSLSKKEMTGIFPITANINDAIFNPNDKKLYVATNGKRFIKIYDTKKFKPAGSVMLPWVINSIAISQNGRFLYAGCSVANKVVIIDLKGINAKEIIKDTGGNETSKIALSLDEKYLYILNGKSRRISIYDLRNKRIKETILLDGIPIDMAIVKSKKNNKELIWVIENDPNIINIIDASTFTKTQRIRLPAAPSDIEPVE